MSFGQRGFVGGSQCETRSSLEGLPDSFGAMFRRLVCGVDEEDCGSDSSSDLTVAIVT